MPDGLTYSSVSKYREGMGDFMKKKFIVSVIVLTMAMFLSGCSNNKNLETENEQLKNEVKELQEKLDKANEAYNDLLHEQADKNSQDVLDDMNNSNNSDNAFAIGETWTINGICSFTFTGAESTDSRNSASDKNPAQVVKLTYDYENLGYENDIQDLFISSSSFQVIDESSEMADTYPLTDITFAQPTPVGAKCAGAQVAYGLANTSTKIKVIVEVRDNNKEKHSATFDLQIQ